MVKMFLPIMKKGMKNPLRRSHLVSPAKTAACFKGNQLSKFDRVPFSKVDTHTPASCTFVFILPSLVNYGALQK